MKRPPTSALSLLRVFVSMASAILALSSCNCEGDNLGRTFPALVPSQTSVDFGEVFIGALAATTLTFENIGTSVLNISSSEIDGDGAVFSADAMPATLDVGERVELIVRFTPFMIDVVTATLVIESNAENAPRLLIALSGNGKVVPNCDDNNACTTDAFDFDTETCTNEFLLDTACDDGNPCSGETRCAGGQCLGVVVTCPPSTNPCERGVCDSSQGCIFIEDETACDDDDPCTIDSCDAIEGCVHEVAEEGRPCGPFGGCETIPLCIAGVCTDVEAPDGIPCIDGDSCTLGDQCQAGECVGLPSNAPMQFIDAARAFGGPRSFSTVSPAGTMFVLDPSGRGVVLTRVVLQQGRLQRQGSIFVDASMDSVVRLSTILGHIVVVQATSSTSFTLFAFDEELQAVGTPSVVELARLDTGPNDLRTLNVDDNGRFAFLCSAAHTEIGVLELGTNGLVVRPAFADPFGASCADVVYEPGNVSFVFASQFLGIQNFGSGFVSRWGIDAQGTLTFLESVNVLGLLGCGQDGAQPQLLAASSAGLLVGCGSNSNGNGAAVEGVHFFAGNTLEPNAEFRLVSPILAVKDFEFSSDDALAILGGIDRLSPRASVCVQAGSRTCSGSRERPLGDLYVNIGDNLLTTSGALLDFTTVPLLRSVTGNAHGTFYSLDVVQTDLLASASKFSTSVFGSVNSGFFEAFGSADGPYRLLGFGPLGTAPIVVLPDRRTSSIRHFDASDPAQVVSLDTYVDVQGSVIAAHGVIYQVRYTNTVATLIVQTPVDNMWATVFSRPLDDRFNVTWTKTLLHATSDRLTILRGIADGTSVVAIFDITNPIAPEILSVQSTVGVPVDFAATGSRLVVVRGALSLPQEEQEEQEQQEQPSPTGYLESFHFDATGRTLLGVLDVPGASKILALEADHTFVADFQPQGHGASFVDLSTPTPTVGQRIDLDGEATALQVLNDVIYFASAGAVEAFSPPCPGAP